MDDVFLNLLPYNGTAFYFDDLMMPAEAGSFFQSLLKNIAWKNEEAIIYGRHIVTKRKAAWYGNKPYAYKYSGITKEALPWTTDLLLIKEKVEAHSGETFNSCLLNLYHSGEEGMGWHSDNEAALQENAAIASVSFGAARTFSFKHKTTKETRSIWLEAGSLLLMKNETQKHWLHSLPKSKKIQGARINLTFRTMAS